MMSEDGSTGRADVAEVQIPLIFPENVTTVGKVS